MLDFIVQFSAYNMALNRLLSMRFSSESPGDVTPLGASLRGILNHHNSGNYLHRDFELQRIGFLIQNLQALEKAAPDLLKHYSKKLRKAGSSDVFYGFRFEVAIAAALLGKGVLPERREHPDFHILASNVGIECTGMRLRGKDAKTSPSYKVGAAIFKKSSKPYATRSVSLFIDITNLAHYSRPFDPEEYRKVVKDNSNTTRFGSVLLFVSLMNQDLNRFETIYLRIDHPDISTELLSFLDTYYPKAQRRMSEYSFPFEA
jgi:hypothetical protein